MTTQLGEDHKWKIIKNFFKTNGLVYQQIDSFNEYINRGIQYVIKDQADIVIEPNKKQKYNFVGSQPFSVRE